ncbi:MAG TPA: aminoglycoside 6'-N-acetyltransferase [Burkholderiales bacterium]|nr:aminoglycoside 6'-N-acetyltransferase [Burkholderiales bacterium]
MSRVESCQSVEQPGWLELRAALWPQDSVAQHRAEMAAFLAEPRRHGQFVAYADDGSPAGFAEASVRSDYVNGTQSSPVAFLEGIYVAPAARRQGVARALVRAVEAWARQRGCRELASDAWLENTASHAMHRALGFVETERVVYFRRPL